LKKSKISAKVLFHFLFYIYSLDLHGVVALSNRALHLIQIGDVCRSQAAIAHCAGRWCAACRLILLAIMMMMACVSGHLMCWE
jgi:hypothetical protein